MKLKLKYIVTITAIALSLCTQHNSTAGIARKASDYLFTTKNGVSLNSIAPGKGGWTNGDTDLKTDTSYQIFNNMDNQHETWNVKLGFTFNYCGQTFTHVSPRSDGYIALTNGTYRKPGGNDYPGLLDNKNFRNILALLWDDQRMSCAAKRTGTAGNYVMTIEMYDIRWDFNIKTKTESKAQLKIYEATGIVEMIYDLRMSKEGKNITHIGISDNGKSYLSVNPTTPASTSSKATHNVTTNIGLGEGASSSDNVCFTFHPNNPKIKAIPKKLLLHYKFDETSGTTVTDSVENNDAKAPNNDSAWQPSAGVFGGAYNLTGEAITIPIKPFDSIDEAVTLSFWLKGSSNNTHNQIFQGLNSNGFQGREIFVHLPHRNGNIFMDFGSNGQSGSATYDRIQLGTPSSVNDNTWHHWVFTKDVSAEKMAIYLDSVLILAGDQKKTPFGSFVTVSVGDGAKGLIDNLKVFNYALTAAEVKILDKIVILPIVTKGTIRGSVPTKTNVKEVIDNKTKLRWYDKNNYFSLLKLKNAKSLLIVDLILKPGYSLSKHDYTFKGKSATYPCLSVSSGRGFGVNMTEVKAQKKNLPVKMLFEIKKGDSKGDLVFNFKTSLKVPDVKIMVEKK